MPMIRYQIRNEYGLADPELYGTAERDDPEELLEGVAMAGLVGVLRQLGDLAEFAADIFHDLHEEVMASAARGHGLILRVQQLEAEFPSIEKAFCNPTNDSNFACNDGIDWHANIQMDQNLVTQGDMPRFIMDSYEECRGPPQLFTLDKFDVAGAGACLKRYSDPSSFKMELASSGMLETELPREKKARKIKKKGTRCKNGETLESLLAPHADSDLQPITSDQVSEKTSRHVRLKSRHSNGMDKSNESSLMEHLLEISSEQKVLFENSIGHSHVKINPIDSNESAPEIYEIVYDSSADCLLVKETNPIQSPVRKEVAGLPLYELETQKIKKKDFSGALHGSFGELKITDSDFLVVEQEEMSTKSGYKSEGSVNGYALSEPEKIPLALQVVVQNKLLGDAECIIEGDAGGYRSDDISSSDLDNFMDALNTMESETETDSECRPKGDPVVLNMKAHGKDSDTNEAQQELQAQFSEPHSVDDSTKSLGSDNMFKNEITSLSDSDASNSAVAQPTQSDMVSLDLTAHSEFCPGKTYNKTTETDSEDTEKSDLGVFIMESHGKDSDSNEAQQELQTQFSEPDSVDNSTNSFSLNYMFKNEMTCVSDSDTTTSSIVAQPTQRNIVSIDLPANSETCPGKIHDRFTEELWQNDEVMEFNSSSHLVSSCCVRDPTSVIVSFHHQGSCHESRSVTGDQDDLPSAYEASEADEATKYLDGLSLESDDLDMPHPAEHLEELTSEDMTETFDMPDHLSQTEHKNMSREAPAGYIEDSLLPSTASIIGERQELAEPDTRACSCGGKSSTISVFSSDINSIASQPDSFATELENGVQAEDIVAERSSGCGEDTHDIAEDFNSSSLGTKDEDVPEKIHPSDYSTELNPEDMATTLDMTSHRSQTQDEYIPEKVPTGFDEDSAPPTGRIGEPQDSIKQDTEACLGSIISHNIPALPLDISFTVQPGGLAEEMENVVAPSEHLTCSSSTVGLQNTEEMGEVNISMPNTLAPELEYSNPEELQEFPCVISVGFAHFHSVEETCPSDMLLQCNVLNSEVIECPIPVDDNLKLLDEPTEHISQENILQTGGPTQFDDIVSENAIFDHNSDNAHPSSTYSAESSGLQVQSHETSILDDAASYQHQVGKQEALTPKDTAVLDCQSIQFVILPLSEEFPLVSAPTAFDPGFSILDSSDPSDSRLLSDVCQTKSSELVQTDLLSNHDEANSVYSLESKQDFGSKALRHGGCENTEAKKPPSTHFLSELTIPLEEAASKLQVGSELNVLSVDQEGEHLHAPTSSIDLNDEPLEQGPELRSHGPASNGDVSEFVIPPSNKPMCSQVELEDSVSSACCSEFISCSLASNVSTILLPSFTNFDVAILETPLQLPFEPQSDKLVSSFPLQDVEDLLPLPPLPPLEWRKGKLQLGSISSVGNLFQTLSETNPSMLPSATDWNYGHGLLADEGEMVKPANPFVTLTVLEAKSCQHDLLKSEGEKMHPFRLSELPPVAGDETYQHDGPFIEGKIVHPSNPSLVVPPLEDKHLYSLNSVGEVMLQSSNSFASLSVSEDGISRHSLPLQGGTLQPSEDTCSRLDQLLPSSDLERSQKSGHSHLSLQRETIHPPNTFLAQPDIEDEKHHYGNGICGVENKHLLQSSVPVPTAGPELPKPGYVTSREDKQSSQFDVLPTPDNENLIVKPRSIRNRPRDPLIEAVAAHDRSTMRKVSEMVQPSSEPKADERDSLLEQIRNKSFNLKPTVVTKPNINGPPTNLKVAAIIEKANAIRQAFVGSDEDDGEDSWSDS